MISSEEMTGRVIAKLNEHRKKTARRNALINKLTLGLACPGMTSQEKEVKGMSAVLKRIIFTAASVPLIIMIVSAVPLISSHKAGSPESAATESAVKVPVPPEKEVDISEYDIESTIEAGSTEGGFRTYYKLRDGTWMCNGNIYLYRLEITGRLFHAVKDSTFVFLSNIEDIPFERAWLAAGLSSNLDDYFDEEEAILVEMH